MARLTREAESVTDADGIEQQSRERAAAHYREYAVQLRELAEAEQDAIIRCRLRAIADEYEARANALERKA